MTRTRHLTPSELAERLGYATATLAEWRCRGVGPKFLKFGTSQQARVRYPEDAVEAWEASNTHANTGAIGAI